MKWLPSIFKSKAPVTVESKNYELQVKQIESLERLSHAVSNIATFLSGEGMARVLGEYSRAQIAKGVLGGLASHDGRASLDARMLKQNATEVLHAIEAVFDKAKEKAEAVAKGETFDPELKDAEAEYLKWKNES